MPVRRCMQGVHGSCSWMCPCDVAFLASFHLFFADSTRKYEVCIQSSPKNIVTPDVDELSTERHKLYGDHRKQHEEQLKAQGDQEAKAVPISLFQGSKGEIRGCTISSPLNFRD